MKKILLLVSVIALLAAGCGSSQPAPASQQPTKVPANSTGNYGSSAPTQTANPAGSTWQGTLELSDNAASGNYTIMVSGHKIYLKTNRDYSSLVGKQVNVSYTGSLTSFVLNDITAQ